MANIATAICLIPIPDHPMYSPDNFEHQYDTYGITVDRIVVALFQELGSDRPDSSAREAAYAEFINYLKTIYSEPQEDAGGFVFRDTERVLKLKHEYSMLWDQVQKDFCNIIVDLERTMNVVSVEGFGRLSNDTYRFTLGYIAQA